MIRNSSTAMSSPRICCWVGAKKYCSPTSALPPLPTAVALAATFATVAVVENQPALLNETPPEPAIAAESPHTPPDGVRKVTPAFTPPASPLAADIPLPLKPTLPVRRKGLARHTAALLIGL